MSEDWGLPDWTRPGKYPLPDSSAPIWAWEFCRRWLEYREFWRTKVEPFRKGNGFIGDPAGRWPHLGELRARFGIECPRPPWESKAPYFAAGTRYVQKGRREAETIIQNRNEIAFFIDLEMPIEPQIDGIRAVVKREQHERRLCQSGKKAGKDGLYTTYLRILDAYETGAKPSEIADQIFPEELFPHLRNEYPNRRKANRLDQTRGAAERLRDGGYMMPPASGPFQTMKANGRQYVGVPGTDQSIPDFDASVLESNGWTKISLSGPTTADWNAGIVCGDSWHEIL